MSIKQKSRTRRGFTLAETLLAILIMLMVSSIVATGIPAAKNAYEKVVLGANAQVLISTTISALRDELGFARNVTASGNTVSYYSAETGIKSEISKDGSGNIVLKRAKGTLTGMGDSRLLVSEAASTKLGLYATYDSVSVDASKGYVEFTGLKVCRNGQTADLAGLQTIGPGGSNFRLRVFAPNTKGAALINDDIYNASAPAGTPGGGDGGGSGDDSGGGSGEG